MTRTQLLASGALLALSTAPAVAQDDFLLGTIVVSPSLSPVDLAKTGATVEVIKDEDLTDADTSLIQTLSRAPGVSFSANGGLGTNTTIRIRGLGNKYVGVRFDGIDVSDPSSAQTSFNFGGLNSAGLGQVEVLKGSQSAIHGSEAIGGVVNLTTLRADGPGFAGTANVEFGSFGTRSGGLSLSHASERGEIALSYSQLQSDGISTRAGDTEEDGFDQNMLTLSTRYQLTDTVTVGASALWRDGSVEIDRSSSDNSGQNFFTQTGARVFAEFETGGVSHEFSVSGFEVDRRDPGGWTTRFQGERKQVQYLGSTDLGAASSLSFGLDGTRESFTLPSASGEATTRSAFAELQTNPYEALDVSLALRADDHSIFGSAVTGRLAAAWHVGGDVTVRSVLGTGFRAPSLYELYGPYGSTTLQPEKSRSFELGVEKALASGFVKATAFYTEIDDLIDYDFVTSGYNQVAGTTVSKGIELEARHALSAMVDLYGNYTLTDARNNGVVQARVPRHDLVLGAEAEMAEGLKGGLEVQRIADTQASAFAPAGHKVGNYTLVNASLSYDVSDMAQVYLRVENLTDEDYETAGGYNTPGRAFYFGVRASF
ncbi:MAG: TonB-dependent receptor plug domain-containing protein [Thalassovita sp.]